MPLDVTTATWPSLVAGRKAKASEVTARTAWLEGDLVPMKLGSMTDGAYNLGKSTGRWATCYTKQLSVNGGSIGALAIFFDNDSNTGLCDSSHADVVEIITGGVRSAYFAKQGLLLDTTGSQSEPSLTWNADADTGFYNASNSIQITLGGNQKYSIEATEFFPIGAGAINLGNSLHYWNDVSYKTLTDRGCLPWCDNGVELADGRIVSDTEALLNIQKHPTKVTVQGLPMLDYKTFPKKAYKQADRAGKPIRRTPDGEPVEGSDGVEMTMMFGVMIGAIKELTLRLAEVEKRLA